MTNDIKPFRVLSIDGGGMRGLYTATLLDELARLFGESTGIGYLDVGKGFDLIVGTSTGGIMACGLAYGLSPNEIKRLYKECGKKIFPNPVPSGIGKLGWIAKYAFKSANPQSGLRLELEKLFKQTTLPELYESRGIALCIPAVNMSNHSARVFKTPHQDRYKLDLKQTLVNVCLATSAAPMILPIASLEDPEDEGHYHAYTDGGLWANNPILISILEALEVSGPNQPIEILSIGTCTPPSGEDILPHKADWGLLNWGGGVSALETALDAQSSGYGYMAGFLVKHLKKDCEVVRLPSSAPPSESAKYIGLDKASLKAVRLLTSLGKNDAKDLFGEATRELNDQGSMLKKIFESMPAFKVNEA